MKRGSRVIRTVCIVIWLMVLAAGVGWYIADPQSFTAQNIAAFLERFQGWIWFLYLLMSVLRGFTLLPSTPLIIAGTILFPGQQWAVFAVSLIGIALSSTMIYYFSEFLGFDDFFDEHKPELTHNIRRRLEHPLGFLFVAAWAFFPLVPTDLVCYLAGTTRMSFWRFIAAVLIGEAILCAVYIFFGGSLLNYVR